jgi:CRISPR-associated protein Cas2
MARLMRLLVFFDLPVKTKKDKQNYIEFRRFLLRDGYYQIQYSVYGRICGGLDRVETHLMRLRANLPPKGSVRCMVVTEKQYASIEILVGQEAPEEKTCAYEQPTLGDFIF